MKFKDKTRGGYPLTLYTTEAGDNRPVHGRIVTEGGEVKLLSWAASGRWSVTREPHRFDLIPLREPSEAAVEAVCKHFGWNKAVAETTRCALRAAYEIDGIDGAGE